MGQVIFDQDVYLSNHSDFGLLKVAQSFDHLKDIKFSYLAGRSLLFLNWILRPAVLWLQDN